MCQCCLLLKKIKGRGLCGTCYGQILRRGREALDRHAPRALRPLADVLEDWKILEQRGMSKREASLHMGYKEKTLERLLAPSRAGKLDLEER